MEKFNTERIEKLKCEFYKLIALLQMRKQIVISDIQLSCFEKSLSECETEDDAAALIYGSITRYKILLEADINRNGKHPTELTEQSKTTKLVEESNLTIELIKESVMPAETFVGSNILVLSAGSSELATNHLTELTEQSNSAKKLVKESNLTLVKEPDIAEMVVDPIVLVLSAGNSEVATNQPKELTEESNLTIELVEASMPAEMDAEANILDLSADDSTVGDDETIIAPPKIFTNSLIENTPTVIENQLTTTRENPSFFLIYSKQNGYDLGCEFTKRRNGKFPRFECKKCRQLCSRDRRSGIVAEKESAVTMNGHQIKEIKKASHHAECCVEYYGTAVARTAKNQAVVFKSKYGGSSKSVYDTHTKILLASHKENITAADMAYGFKTFERAKPALKKSSTRKSAIKTEPVLIEGKVIDRDSTLIVKSIQTEPVDYFLIGQDPVTGVIVLGSRFLVERFFRSKHVMSDGTFKMAPVHFKQAYMLWSIVSGQYKDEVVHRSKANFGCCFILPNKQQATYDVAFKILDDYRKKENIPDPHFDEFLTDDEVAVRNVVKSLYPDTDFALCLFHHNQNIVKCMVQHKLTAYVRKCKEDEQLWFYWQLKKILVIPLLQLGDMVPAFKMITSHILKFVESKFENPFEIQQFKTFLKTIEERYFSCEDKMKMVCKYGKSIRTTNPVEARHGVFNNSSLVPQKGTVSNFISALMTTDFQHRAMAIDFETNGAVALAKKRKQFVKQQTVILECTENLKNNKIDIDEFLSTCAEVMIHPKYYKLVEEATKRFEMEKDNVVGSLDDTDTSDEFDENIQAIFATEETTNKRVRKLCTKYFGEDWLN